MSAALVSVSAHKLLIVMVGFYGKGLCVDLGEDGTWEWNKYWSDCEMLLRRLKGAERVCVVVGGGRLYQVRNIMRKVATHRNEQTE